MQQNNQKDIIDEYQVTFEEVPIHDDTKFSYQIGHYAKKIKVDERAIYCISQSPNSISFSLTDDKYLTRMHVIGERDRFVRGLGLNLDCTGKFLLRTLSEIRDAGKVNLYEECLGILEGYGFQADMLRRKINDCAKRRSRIERQIRLKTIIKRFLIRCHFL